LEKNELYMHRCIELAKLAMGNVAPNPMVGAVLVYQEKIIAEGYHKKIGEPHAEVNCINSVKEEEKHLVEKSTLYVSLEPCSHFGKTPPCTELIIKNKIPKVVIGCKDVFKEVDGRGIKKLLDAGVEVTTGVLENECKELNRRFFTFHQQQRPYIILKWAESVDGKIAGTGTERSLISNEYSNRLVHKWRSEEAAILVGKQTALKDDPSLTTRVWAGEHPVRLVIDTNLSLPPSLKIFDGATPTVVFNLLKDEDQVNLKWIKLNNGDVSTAVTAMHRENIQSVIVEGGALLLQSFIDAGIWDEARVIRNEELVIGNGLDAPKLTNATLQKQERQFTDTISYFLKR
jgi:diaminohydroxyphosphoribosylaminopyrimidine deaminase/5-amino-6-(5-phosphoribosylamino)uracil reductase